MGKRLGEKFSGEREIESDDDEYSSALNGHVAKRESDREQSSGRERRIDAYDSIVMSYIMVDYGSIMSLKPK